MPGSPPAARSGQGAIVAVTHRSIPESLQHPGLSAVWVAVRRRLDSAGPEWRGTIARPELDRTSTLTLESLLGHRATKRLDLDELETALVDRGVGDDLCIALSRLGHPPSKAAAQRRAARARSEEARTAFRDAVASWNEPWASAWADDMVRSGNVGALDGHAVNDLIANVRRLLKRLDQVGPPRLSRTELASALYGSAHALDRGRSLTTAIERALRHRVGSLDDRELDGRELWEAAGILTDRVSAPVLTWSLPAAGASPLDVQIRAATSGTLPVHISLVALQKYPISVPSGSPVLVVENPRLVEAAAERNRRGCVVATNGNPTTAVTTLLEQLRRSGASLRYHGDFDAPGIAICRRMHTDGCTPWMMGAADYEDAVRLAETSGVRLEDDPRDCGPTPWDPMLSEAFGRRRLIIHEEFLLDIVLDKFDAQPHPPSFTLGLRGTDPATGNRRPG